MLQEVTNHGASGSTPPPGCRQGVKNDHSPWSAPRERKRRPKPADVVLSSIEEIEYTTSPPKRHNGGSSPAARELALQNGPLGSPFAADAALAAGVAADAGPLAQGLVAAASPSAAAGSSSIFSPLASGLRAPSFTAGCQNSWPLAGGDKQRKQLRQAAAFRLAASRQRAAANEAAAEAGAGAPMNASLPTADSACLWQPGSAPAALQSFNVPRPQQQRQQQQQHILPPLSAPEPLLAPPQHQRQQLSSSGMAAALDTQQANAGSTGAEVAAMRCSTAQEMETDLRCSWGSDRSADVTGWQALQAQLREVAGEELSPPPCGLLDSQDGALLRGQPALAAATAACQRQSSLADDPMRASADCGISIRSSLEGALCSERQASLVPLRAATRGHHWQSHLSSPPVDGTSPDPLLGPSSGGSSRRRSRGGASSSGTVKWSCFSCASPFNCKQRPRHDDSDDEVIRRNDSEGDFVLHRKPSSPSPPPSMRDTDQAERRKHTSLNRPPSGESSDVAGRQPAFSTQRTPGTQPASSSPRSEAGSDDSFSLASGPGLRSVGLRDASLEELAVEGGGAAPPTPSVDALNDMLKALSLCPAAHPRDAEELVARACQNHAIQPNATTARTLEKMWAVHEQLYG